MYELGNSKVSLTKNAKDFILIPDNNNASKLPWVNLQSDESL